IRDREHAFPDFTLAYFPDNDFNSHAQGPESAAHTLTQFDDYLGQIFDAYGGIDQMLGDIAIIITGDHSQSNIVSDPNDAAILLSEVLQDFSAAELGKGWDDGTDIILCPNGRVASIYHRNLTQENADQIIANLLQEPRIDQVIYSGRHLGSSDSGYHVVTRDRGKLQFEKASGQQETLHDLYGTRWAWRGDLGVFGETESDDNVTIFPEYPNPFERIAGILESSRSGHIWATARIGHDFVIPGIDAHAGGGSHGSLHSLDSSPPMFVAGTTSDIQLPQHPRSIDLVPLSLKILNIDPEKVE
ncbi:MAG: hypothetical protein GYB66_15525, partial [Chloroflexi bacterium]|nr:hypothetical protein [Chloroflexota bacterium]